MFDRAAACLLLGVSVPACSPPLAAVSYSIGGEERVVAGDGTPEMRLRALADQAGRDFGCPAERVRAEARVPLAVYTAEACGERGVYLMVVRRGVTEGAPGFAGTAVWLDMTRFALVSEGEPARVLDDLARVPYHDDAPGGAAVAWSLPWHFIVPGQAFAFDPRAALEALRPWIALSIQGARDLGCPRGEVVVELRSGPRGAVTPLAEGCGKRAVYLSGALSTRFDLASIVPLPRP